ncbi:MULTISPECIES: GumC family protein [unclassified Ensifer]|uniref:GumC family protein n=1 Tax=Ensifer TaxID=106591 RepID=UPI00070E6ABC|nr:MULTISPECIES: GumC family protein [unclassified Ensifer]KQU72596.1 cell shape-determining protein [Ensifer sp. Root31]KQY57931.1 cell shape-determining protein [Ensifer sp. Root142]MBD9488696.1 GumC family protein [Ensifer sp. ENS11]
MYRPNEPRQQRSPQPAHGQRAMVGGGSLLNLLPTDDEDALPPFEEKQAPRREPEVRRSQVVARAQTETQPTPHVGGLFFPRLHLVSQIGVDDGIRWLRDGMLWIIAAVTICTFAALVYAMTASPRYTVYTDIVVDPSNLNVVSDDVFTSNPQRDAQLLEVESKLRILTSRNVLARVIDELQLTRDPEFVKPASFASLRNLFSSKQEQEVNNELAAMRGLSERVEARREERSFVVVMKVWSEEPAKAVTLSNAIVDAFEQELFQSAAESAGRVAKNLNARLDELRRNVTDAERAVEDFRRVNGLQSTNGQLVSNQLSGELNTQVLDAQQRFIQAETRYNQMSAAIAQGRTASASEFESENMTNLREQYNLLQQQIASMQRTFGERHPRLVSARSERATIEGALADEARRILERAKADMDREQQALEALRGKANVEKSNVFTDNESQVQLRDLERDARAKAAIYETHLARAQQITEQQQIDTTNVRVISRALPPNARTWPPRTVTLLVAGAMLGLFLGVSAAIALGLWRYIRRPQPATA